MESRESRCKNDSNLKGSVEMPGAGHGLGAEYICVEVKGASFKTDSHPVLWVSHLELSVMEDG